MENTATAQFSFQRLDDQLFSENGMVKIRSHPRYNRVEGLFINGAVNLTLKKTSQIGAIINTGYGVKNQKWRYEIGLQKQYGEFDRLILRASLFDEMVTNDSWMLSTIENSLASASIREDFYDYFGRKGWRVLADKKIMDQHIVRIEFAHYRYESMPVNSRFAASLLGGRKSFRPNPPIEEGKENSASLMFLLDWRDNPYFPVSGFCLEGILRTTFGDFQTNGIFIKGEYFLPIFELHTLFLKSVIGFHDGSAAPQHLMTIGGVGSLRGFQDHLHHGQNFVLFTSSYSFNGTLLAILGLDRLPVLNESSLALFADVGDAWYAVEHKRRIYDGFTKFVPLLDAGISFKIMDGLLRFDFARQLYRGDGEWRITCRLFDRQ